MSNRLYLSNLLFDVDYIELREWLEDDDWVVLDVYVPPDREHQGGFKNKGYAFVEFETEEEAESAIEELDGELGPGGRPMNLSVAHPRQQYDEAVDYV